MTSKTDLDPVRGGRQESSSLVLWVVLIILGVVFAAPVFLFTARFIFLHLSF